MSSYGYHDLLRDLDMAIPTLKQYGPDAHIANARRMYGVANQLFRANRSADMETLWLKAGLVYLVILAYNEPAGWKEIIEEMSFTPYPDGRVFQPQTEENRRTYVLLLTNAAIVASLCQAQKVAAYAAGEACKYYAHLRDASATRWHAAALVVKAQGISDESERQECARYASMLLERVAPESELAVLAKYLSGDGDGRVSSGTWLRPKSRRASISLRDLYCFQD